MDTPLDDASTDLQVKVVAEELTREFERVPAETVHRVVAEEFGSFSESRIRTFVPILVRRSAKQRLLSHAGRGSA